MSESESVLLFRNVHSAAAELTVQDLIENMVVKVADEVEVDVSKSAWSVSYEEAIENAKEVVLSGIRIPFLSLPDLIKSKETYRKKISLTCSP